MLISGRTRCSLAAALIGSAACAPAAKPGIAQSSGTQVTFFAIGDPQINIPRWGTAGTDSTIVLMTGLPGEPFPFGGAVSPPVGVIVAGDLVDDVRSAADWEYYKTLFDPEGRARLRIPAFEGLGNHNVDVRGQPPGTFNPQQQEFIERNRRRPGTFSFDEQGYHYAWEWGGVRFIQLNLFPGTQPRPVYDAPAEGNDPKGSLAFLRRVLEDEVGDNGQPIIATWHYGLRGWGLEKWWLPEDLDSLAAVLKGHNVLLLLHGHEHRYERYQWHGYDVVMAPSPQIDRDPERPQTASRPKGFLVFRITRDELQLAHRTAEGWQETWSKRIQRPAGAGRSTP